MYSPKLKDELVRKLYEYKETLDKKKPLTKLIAEAVEEYLERRNSKTNKALQVKLKSLSFYNR